MVPLCVTRRSVVRLLDLAELRRSGGVDVDAAMDAASRTPVLGVVVRQWGVGEPAQATAVVVAGSSRRWQYALESD